MSARSELSRGHLRSVARIRDTLGAWSTLYAQALEKQIQKLEKLEAAADKARALQDPQARIRALRKVADAVWRIPYEGVPDWPWEESKRIDALNDVGADFIGEVNGFAEDLSQALTDSADSLEAELEAEDDE